MAELDSACGIVERVCACLPQGVLASADRAVLGRRCVGTCPCALCWPCRDLVDPSPAQPPPCGGGAQATAGCLRRAVAASGAPVILVGEDARRAACRRVVTFHAQAAAWPTGWRRRAVEAMAAQIELLPAPQRLVMALVHGEDLAFGEVTAVLDVSAQEVIQRHRAASERLVSALLRAGIHMALPPAPEHSPRAQ